MTGERDNPILLVAGIIVSLVALIFGLRPMLAAYHDHELAAAARVREVKGLEETKIQLARLDQEVSAKTNLAERLRLSFPTDDGLPELVAQAAALAAESGLALVALQPVAASSGGQGETRAALIVRGSYPQIVGLVERLETNLRPASIGSINFVVAGADGGELSVTLQIGFGRVSAKGGS